MTRCFTDKVHGNRGDIHIEKSNFGRLNYEWEQAGKELGYKIMDPNGFQEEGYARLVFGFPQTCFWY